MTSTNDLTFALNEKRATKGRVRQNLIRAATSLFLRFSVSPSVSRNFANCFNVEICHIPLKNWGRHVDITNFTLLIFNNFPAGYTRRVFINLKVSAISNVRPEHTCDFILDSDLVFDEISRGEC